MCEYEHTTVFPAAFITGPWANCPLPHISRLMKSEGASGSPVDWTVSDVVSYFTAAGFPEQAAAFRTQVRQ